MVKSYGYKDDENILVMQLLGKSLEDLFIASNKRFTLKTVCMLADQLVIFLFFKFQIQLLGPEIIYDLIFIFPFFINAKCYLMKKIYFYQK